MVNEDKFADEMMSDDELDNVTGGTYLESLNDVIEFKKKGIEIYKTVIWGVPVLGHDEFVKLRDAFQQYGVTLKDNGGLKQGNQYFIGEKLNQYFIGEKLVTREEAWKHINAQFNK